MPTELKGMKKDGVGGLGDTLGDGSRARAVGVSSGTGVEERKRRRRYGGAKVEEAVSLLSFGANRVALGRNPGWGGPRSTATQPRSTSVSNSSVIEVAAATVS